MPWAFAVKTGFRRQSSPTKSSRRRQRVLPLVACYLLLGSLCGCSLFSAATFHTTKYVKSKASATKDVLQSQTLHYLGDSELNYYKDVATQIDYTHVAQEKDDRAAMTQPPRRIRHPGEDEILDMTLAEAIHRALANSEVIRDRGQFLSPGNIILNSPLQAASVFDPAIQETGILLGNRGVEAALADFDTNLAINSLWGRNEQVQNNRFTGNGLTPGETLMEDSANFSAQLQKPFATGGTFSVNHNVNYSLNNVPFQQSGRLFGSFYTGNLQAQYRHPLLAGSGVDFNRIAGPLAANPLRVSGVNQGVVIARINNDIAIADFEVSVRNLLRDVEDLYWELSLAYRAYDAEIVARNSNLKVWKITKVKYDVQESTETWALAQAEEAYFDSRGRAEDALARIYSTEAELRRLMGMPLNDGYILRPVDDPATAEFLPDWHISLAEALTGRVELRRQKWTIKSLELQLKASKTLTRPRFDFVSGYQVNGFGDTLLDYHDDDEVGTRQGLNSFYETLTQGNQTGWNLGFEFTMPIGFRTAHSQVRNLELQLAKARAVLANQELEVSHELGRAFQDLDRAYQTAQTNFNRRRSAELRVQALQNAVFHELAGPQGQNYIDLLLRAQTSLAQAEVAYFSSLVAYNQAITAIHFRKGSLLEFNNVALAEGGWDPQAYVLALRRAWSRSHALDADHLLNSEPGEFVTGPETLELLMPYEETRPLMPEAAPDGNLPLQPVPETPRVPTPGSRPYEEPRIPVPAPLDDLSADPLGWRKRGPGDGLPGDLFEADHSTTTRRQELPLR
jgi:outer membrane protein TolC